MSVIAEGFTPPRDVAVVGGSRIELCTCYVCGAAIVLDWDDLHDPREVHLCVACAYRGDDGGRMTGVTDDRSPGSPRTSRPAHVLSDSELAALAVHHGIPTLFVGGEFDGQMRRVLDFRDSSTPDGYHPVETWGQANGTWARMDDKGRLPGTTHRLEVAFAVGEPWTNDRIMQAMARGLGVLFVYGQHAYA